MKHILLKAAAVAMLALGVTSCSDELDISSIDPKSSPSYDMMQLLAKQYATLGVTGQIGPSGDPDLSEDEGEKGFYRTVFNLEDMPSDECLWAWQNDEDVPAITNLAWTANSTRARWAYMRMAYDITLYNQFLTEESGNAGPQLSAEVRFLRALHYYYFLDLFHKAPFKLRFDISTKPTEKANVDLYNWLDQELTNIEDTLATIGSFDNSENFGRADQGAAFALHAQLALNSEVYTDGKINDYKKAKDYCDRIINSGKYALSTNTVNGFTGYEQLFMGDNDVNQQAMKEIIFPIRQDGDKTEEYAGSTFLIASTCISGMPYRNTNNYWSCYFAREDLVKKFFADSEEMPQATERQADDYKGHTEAQCIAYDDSLGISTKDVQKKAGDDRALLYMGVGGGFRTINPGQTIHNFNQGASIVKWTNLRSDLSGRHSDTFDDTDIPLFRLGVIYLTRAEAEWRLGDNAAAIADINVLRDRAHASRITNISAQLLIDEWCRETFFEGRRRSDLVRFGLFTGSDYLWDFKGGKPGGTSVDSRYNVYPIPAIDLTSNPNMTQNPGY